MEITGYKYLTEEQALNAVELCNEYYGIPVSPDDETKNWCEYKYDEYYSFYYIIYDESLEVVLGNPTTFDIHIELT
jgi:hypothetical protein